MQGVSPAPRRLPSACCLVPRACALGRKRKSSSTSAVTAGERRARCGDGSPTPAAQSLRGTHRHQNLPRTTAQAAPRGNGEGQHAGQQARLLCTAFRARRGLRRRGKRALAPIANTGRTMQIKCLDAVGAKQSIASHSKVSAAGRPAPREKTARPTRRAGSGGSDPGPGAKTRAPAQ
ncbi:hypothetical protein ERJ75_001156200 [Trypanosoma vivax]|nr:hypothetical protein ERJ75_001156200 [Trypanosoma vivax]